MLLPSDNILCVFFSISGEGHQVDAYAMIISRHRCVPYAHMNCEHLMVSNLRRGKIDKCLDESSIINERPRFDDI